MNKAELTQPSRTEIELMMKKKQMMANNGGQNNIPELNDDNNESLDFVMRKKRKMMQREKRKMMKKQRKMEKAKMRERKRQMRQKNRRMKKQNMASGNGNGVGPVIDCMVTEWTPWESCTAVCGKQYITRARMIKVQPQNGGKKCPKKLIKRRKCKGLPRCCEYTHISIFSFLLYCYEKIESSISCRVLFVAFVEDNTTMSLIRIITYFVQTRRKYTVLC